MQSEKNKLPLVVIVGPTAVGKTDLAITLAKRLNGEIVSADSRLFYRGMDIGTAKPTCEEMKIVPHHLIDVAEPDEIWSLAIYQKAATEIIEQICSRGKLPFLVGGTGQYIHAVIQGWSLPAQEPDHRLRDILEQWVQEIGAQALHDKLRILDADAAEQIQYQNYRRTIRALEVVLMTGRKFSAQKLKTGSPFNHLVIGLNRPRAELYERIDLRIEAMLQNGLVEETQRLLDKGYSRNLSTLSAIGYREIIAYLKDEITLGEAVVLMKRLTRQFVRRQANWFSPNDAEINWFDMDDKTLERVENLIRTQYKML